MSYILHTDSGQKFQIDGKTADQVKEEIKAAGLTIGNVTVTRLVSGALPAASGFERIESLTEEEQQEQDRAVADAKAETALATNEQQQLDVPADNQTTAANVVTGGDNSDNAESEVAAPADTIQAVAPNLPNETDAPHVNEPAELEVGNLTPEGQVVSPETSITEPAADNPVLTVSNDPNTEATLVQPTNADGTVASSDVAATDVNDVNAPAPADQLGGTEGDLNPDNAAAEQQATVNTDVVEAGPEGADKPLEGSDVVAADGVAPDASLAGVNPAADSEPGKDPAVEQRTEESQSTQNADAIRRRMLGNAAADAISESENAGDDKAREVADGKLKAKSKSNTPVADTGERKRRHNRREDSLTVARTGQHAKLIEAIEAGVTPKLTLNYVHPDERWFHFTLADKVDPENPTARKNPFIDLSPLKDGGYNFGLYVNGKSAKQLGAKRMHITKDQDVVKELTDYLAEAIKTTGI